MVVDLVDANGREADRSADLVPEDHGFCVSSVRVDEHVRDDSVPVEGLPIC